MTKTISDLILEQLTAYGVHRIFGVVGDAIFPLADALGRQQAITYIPATIESAAAFMAVSYAKISGELGVCIGTSGPGAASFVNGTAEAHLDGVPLLCLTGQVATAKYRPGAKQFLNQQQLFSAVTSLSQSCLHPEAALPILSELIHQALTGRTAVHLDIPTDILAAPAQGGPVAPRTLRNNLSGTGIISGDWETAVQAIQARLRPLIVVGREARDIASQLASFAAIWGAGIILAQEAKGAIPDEHPLVIGGIGEAYCPECLSGADLILLWGTAGYEERFFPAGASVIQFIPYFPADRPQHPAVIADYQALFARLRQIIPERTDRGDWRLRIDRARQDRLNMIAAVSDGGHPLAFFRVLSAKLAEDAVIALDVGEFVYWFDSGFIARRELPLLSSKWRSMGGSLPGGIAAAIHRPRGQTVVICGDGGFLMSLPELATIARNRLPITVFVLANHQYGLENQKMVQKGFAPFGTDLFLPDLVQLAESFGLKGYRISDPLRAEAVIAEALREAPALVEVAVKSAPLPYL